MPNTSDGLPTSQRSAGSKHVSVRLEPKEIARVDALVPSLIQFGTVPTRTIALRATISLGSLFWNPDTQRSSLFVQRVRRVRRAWVTRTRPTGAERANVMIG